MMKRRSGRARRSSAGRARTAASDLALDARQRGAPMRVMMRMFATTYGLSVSSTPQRASGESIGPMQ
jgi:hypothetical protein